MTNSVIKRGFDAPVVHDDDWRREKRKEKGWEEERRKNASGGWKKRRQMNGKERAVSWTIDERNCKRSNANVNHEYNIDGPSYGPGPAPNFLAKLISIGTANTRTCLDGDRSSKRQIVVNGAKTMCLATCDHLDDIFNRGRGYRDYLKDRWDDFFASVHSYLDVSCERLDRAWTGRKRLLESLGRRYEAPGEQRAIKYLENAMKKDRFLGYAETVQSAITALNYLLAKNLKDDEIKVYVFGKDARIDDVLKVEEIEKHLTDINNLSESKSDSLKKREETDWEGLQKTTLAWWRKQRQGKCIDEYNWGGAPAFFVKLILIGAEYTTTGLSGECSSKRQVVVKGTKTLCLVTCEHLEDVFDRGRRCQTYFQDSWDDFFASVHSYLDISCESLGRAWTAQALLRKSSARTGQALLRESLLRRYEAPGEERAVKYLENKMKKNRFLNHEETIQTAITALKYLLGKNLKADEIKVYVFGKDCWIDDVLQVEEIEKHLSDINNLSDSKSDGLSKTH